MSTPNFFLPASSQIVVRDSKKLYQLSSTSVNSEGLYSLVLPKSESIRPGIKVKFYAADYTLLGLGFITYIDESVIYCKSFTPLNSYPTQIEFFRGWTLEPGESFKLYDPEIFVPSNQKCYLTAHCSFPSSHVAGLIRWSLYYLSEETYYKVLDGSDANTLGVCSYEHSGRWKAGVYEIKAERYSSQSSILLSSDTQSWTLVESSNQLSCGGYSDPLPLLSL